MSFSENGFVDMGRAVDVKECERTLAKIRSTRPWGLSLFLEETKFRENPVMKGVNPTKGRNILEKVDTSFVEDNYSIKEYLRAILGPVTVTLDKKAVAAIPTEWIPTWVKREIEARPVPNLGAYIKPDYRDITYFHGIDWHQDIIDYPDRFADFITLYVYLDDVGHQDSPLQVIPKSHLQGADVFPHEMAKYADLDRYTLCGPAGSAYIWHSCVLHGTQPSPGANVAQNRISLRYVVAKAGANGYLLDEVNGKINGPLCLRETRRDLDQKGHGILKGNQINET